jgi:hypothetical protein
VKEAIGTQRAGVGAGAASREKEKKGIPGEALHA